VHYGGGGTWRGAIHGNISVFAATLLAANGANASMGFTSGITGALSQDTTGTLTPTLAVAWGRG
jgi:hypothetical protein